MDKLTKPLSATLMAHNIIEEEDFVYFVTVEIFGSEVGVRA